MTPTAQSIRNAPITTPPVFDVMRLREDFPILARKVHGKSLAYLDNAATTQKPQSVIDAVTRYYTTTNANIHRGVHTLSVEATDAFEAARGKVRRFINAGANEEIVFVRGATEAVNLVADAFVRPRLQPGDEILITNLEHHSNIVPWQLLCEPTGAKLRVIPINDAGELEIDAIDELLGDRTRFLSLAHVSNALGTVNPIADIIQKAHQCGIPVMIDGAQAVPHLSVDVRALDCDFYAFSSHKMFGPTGVGVLYGRRTHLEAMPPYQGGGDMISSVTFDKTTYNKVPHKFEAGTPDIAGVIAFGAAIDYLAAVGMDRIADYEHRLLSHAAQRLSAVPEVTLIGTAKQKAAVVSFVVDGVHPHDVGTILDQEGIAVRTGHHCAQPVMDRFGIPATVRVSLAFYNTVQEIDRLEEALQNVVKVFRS